MNLSAVNNEVILTNRNNVRIRSNVVHETPTSDNITESSITVRTTEWLDFGTYTALYVGPEDTVAGDFEVWSYTLGKGQEIFINGRFRPKNNS